MNTQKNLKIEILCGLIIIVGLFSFSLVNAYPAWDLSGESDGKLSFHLNISSQDTSAQGLAFNNNGTKMYIVGQEHGKVYQYELSDAWNINSASYNNDYIFIGSQDSQPRGLFFKPDGTKMYIVGSSCDSVYQYSLSTPWDINTSNYDSQNFSVTSQDTGPSGINFKPDGTKMYIVGFNSSRVYQYSLSTPWDINTTIYDSKNFSVISQETSVKGLSFKPDGTKMYIVGFNSSRVYQYSLSTPWDINTTIYDNVNLSTNSDAVSPISLTFKQDGTKLYVLGNYYNNVLQYVLKFSMGGDGTLYNPYKISTCDELQSIWLNTMAHYILSGDIDCSDTPNWNDGKGFIPNGYFYGSFDGKGYVISNLYINRSSGNLGLFANIGNPTGEETTISNVRLKNLNITYGGTSTDEYTGGIVGFLNTKGKILNSYVSGNIQGYRFVGGLTGDCFGTISNSYSNVTVIANQHHIGGLVGILESGAVINNSYALGNVSGDSGVGGLLGTINGGTIINSYSTGHVDGIDSIGYNSVGGLIGFVNSAGTVTNSFWDGDTSGQLTSSGGTRKTTAEMKTQSTFTNWDFINPWRINNTINNGYPYLRVYDFSGGSGISSNPFTISSCTQLQNMNRGLTLSYILNKNINCSDTVSWNAGKGFIPIGSSPGLGGIPFTGSLDGDGYFVDNLFINRSSEDQGLIGFLDTNGTVTNIGVTNVNITKLDSEYNNEVGAIVGWLSGTINNSYSTGTITGGSSTIGGGLVGFSANGTIYNSYSSVKINPTQGSGLVGRITNDTIIDKSYSYGNVTSGGLISLGSESCIVTNSFWDINTSGQTISYGGTGKTTTEMKTQSTFTNTDTEGLDDAWDFINTWKMNTIVNNGYPYLTIFKIYFANPTTSSGYFSQDFIDATTISRVTNSDTINISLYNSTGLVKSFTSTDNYFSANFTNLSNGIYYLNATVNDTEDNKFSTSTHTIILDTLSPKITINEPIGTKNSSTITFNISLNDTFGYDTCIYWVTRGETTEISNKTINCSDEITGNFTLTLFNANYNFNFYVTDNAGNINISNSSFTVSVNPSQGGGGATIDEVEKIPTIALKQITGEKIYSELERSIFYARINNFCSIQKTSQSLAIQDFSGECSIRKSDLEEIQGDMFVEGFPIEINDLILFYENYNKKELEQVYITLDNIKTYDLFTSVLGITNPMRINPPRLDKPFIIFSDGNFTIEQVFVVNKKVKECSIISGDGFECEVITNNSVKMILNINDTDFFDKIFKGEMSITSDAEPENIEVRRISLFPRVYNFSHKFAGIPAIIFLIVLGVLALMFSIFFIVKGRIRKSLKRGKS